MIPVSWLAKYVYCPRQLFLEVVEGIMLPEEPRMMKGKLSHTILSSIFKNQSKLLSQTQSGMSKHEFLELFYNGYLSIAKDSIALHTQKLKRFGITPVEVFEQHLPILKRLAIKRANEAFVFASTFNTYGNKLAEKLYPKAHPNVFLSSEKLNLKGEIDLVEEYPDTSVAVEIKFSSSPQKGVWESDQIQLGAYILLLREGFHTNANRGYVEYLPNAKRVGIVMNSFLEQEIFKIRDSILKMLESKQVPDVLDSKTKCRECGFKDVCYGNTS
ncbi:CRISPR-associated protein Cas4 [Candidatus Woesearchaeota archaeon]|nr:CRISPR-associated protein Cas4 [Candidatus Woesearchaeota archaeon]